MKVGILGGGIAGLATAIILRDRLALDVDVLERAPEVKEVGAGLSLWPNATRCLQELQIFERIEASSSVIRNLQLKDRLGNTLSTVHADRFATPALSCLRPDLLSALLDRASELDCRVRLDSQVAHLEVTSQSVRVDTVAGSSYEYDFVIAADGVRSAARSLLFPQSIVNQYSYLVYRGITNLQLQDYTDHGIISESWGPGLRFGVLPSSKTQVYWYAAVNNGMVDAEAKPAALGQIAELFQSFHAPIPQLIAATAPEMLLCNTVLDLAPLPRWSKARLLLIGDSAHATTPNMGQGACMALEDAILLAQCLKKRNLAVEAAFQDFEKLRKPRTSRVISTSRRAGDMGQWQNSVAAWFRDAVTRITPDRVSQSLLDWAIGYDVTKAS